MKKGKWQTKVMGVLDIDEVFGLDKVLKKGALKQEFTIEQWTLIQRYHDKCAGYAHIGVMNFIVEQLEESLNIDLTELKF